jgi:site-specific DNA-methyltransferase (adenine-specific)
MPVSEVKNIDCMIAMRDYPDKFFDLAIVDTPFGIGPNWKKDTDSKFYTHESSYKNDVAPGEEYFTELKRVSKDQIIWGCNYFWNFLPPTNNLIFWDKDRDVFTQFNSAGELAWTSIKKYPFNKVKITWNGCVRGEPRYGFHPHEKPIGLYRWLLKHYANPGDKILDTHLGSGSSRIAAYDMGFDFTGFEIDESYFIDQEKRFQQHIAQLKLTI